MARSCRQRATYGERAFLTCRTFEIGIAYADKQHSRLALHRNQFDDVRRNGSVQSMQSQPNHQYLRYSCSCGESDIARLQQRQHGDCFDIIGQSLFRFGGNRDFRYEQTFRQRRFFCGNRSGIRQTQSGCGNGTAGGDRHCWPSFVSTPQLLRHCFDCSAYALRLPAFARLLAIIGDWGTRLQCATRRSLPIAACSRIISSCGDHSLGETPRSHSEPGS